MKKVIVFFLVAFMAVTVGAQQSIDPEFLKIYNQAVELNRPYYPNFHKIPISAPLVFPDYDGTGTICLAARPPKDGKNDCIWYATEEYQKNKMYYDDLKPTLIDSLIWNTQAPTSFSKAENEEPYIVSHWDTLLLSLLFLLSICLLFYHFVLKPARISAMNSINANPVLPGGLSNNASRAREQINGLTAGLQIIKVERGRIFGTADSKVSMQFSDKVREVNLISGDNAYRVTMFDGSVSYYRQHCGNLIAPVSSGQFNLPDDWVFVPFTDDQSTWSAPTQTEEAKPGKEEAKPKVEEAKPGKEEELPLEVFIHVNHIDDSILTGKDIALILEAAGNMNNVPVSIIASDLCINFSSKEEKEE